MELGAGDGEKVKFLIEKAVKEEYDFEYVPIDISHGSNLTLVEAVKKVSPHIKMTALTALYEEGIKWAHDNKQGRNVFACVGGSIGNFEKSEREKFFEFMKGHMKKGDMAMWAIDLKKDPETIRLAYFDHKDLAVKCTEHVLSRINGELHANFDLGNFFPYVYYDPYVGDILDTIVSKCDQTIRVRDREFEVKKSEVILVAPSKKWDLEELEGEMKAVGMELVKQFTDKKGYFMEALFQKQ